MKESPEQYISRILSYQQGKRPMAVLAATPGKLVRLLAGRTPTQLTGRPAPDRWSVGEILAHLADGEIVLAFRLRRVIGSSGAVIQAFDQDVWAEAFVYKHQNPRESLETFRSLRAYNISLLRRIPHEYWDRYGMHEERGKETILRMAEMYAGHDINHVRQIESIIKSFPPQKKVRQKKKAPRKKR